MRKPVSSWRNTWRRLGFTVRRNLTKLREQAAHPAARLRSLVNGQWLFTSTAKLAGGDSLQLSFEALETRVMLSGEGGGLIDADSMPPILVDNITRFMESPYVTGKTDIWRTGIDPSAGGTGPLPTAGDWTLLDSITVHSDTTWVKPFSLDTSGITMYGMAVGTWTDREVAQGESEESELLKWREGDRHANPVGYARWNGRYTFTMHVHSERSSRSPPKRKSRRLSPIPQPLHRSTRKITAATSSLSSPIHLFTRQQPGLETATSRSLLRFLPT